MSKPFANVQVGPYEFSHRVVLAPLSRLRAEEGGIPGALMAEYYSQRASQGGFLITESSAVLADGNGYLGSPGMYDDRQVAGWRLVTDAVHAKGGKVFAQIYHAGRQSHEDLRPKHDRPVGPSEVPHNTLAHTSSGWAPATPNRALEIEELPAIVEGFRAAAQRAMAAGFDGVELHGANGYLLDQFLQDGSNKRTDSYGGSIANRARLLLEATRAVISVWGSQRVAVRLSPGSSFGEMVDSNPHPLFEYVVKDLDKLNLAYLHLIEPRWLAEDGGEEQKPVVTRELRHHYSGVVIAAGGFEGRSAQALVEEGDADLIAFGRHFVANPDLPKRLRRNLPLNRYDRSTFYGGSDVGYTDYPFHQDEEELTEA
ncbi:alkene reductase [Caballeronia insecticola]|uniref:NADH:flavin oxidoreductase/NADH oxidase n=1 Tax=Caballeronia insecticola TaxID=758793 RepID=A0A060PJ85_9BURK|nr:alkene reductase [Caballeronia insecticola]BAO93983.1 NADH:flavin oxidoreductase/NADH oxidase [Caballeronia insecticola]